jgi:hypothetical protein
MEDLEEALRRTRAIRLSDGPPAEDVRVESRLPVSPVVEGAVWPLPCLRKREVMVEPMECLDWREGVRVWEVEGAGSE